MEVYRVVQEKYAEDLSGNGSRLFGGRWNNEGLFALYTSGSRALAMLETLAHTPLKFLLSKTYILVSIFFPEEAGIEIIETNTLPSGWNAAMTHPATKKSGDRFIRSKKNLVLKVPSVLMEEEYNYVINPENEQIRKVKIIHQRQLKFDTRLFQAI